MNWISVRDRLPEKNKDVLIAVSLPTEKRYMIVMGYITGKSRLTKEVGDGVWWNFYDEDGRTSTETKSYALISGELLQEITHWMPLPDAPRCYYQKYKKEN